MLIITPRKTAKFLAHNVVKYVAMQVAESLLCEYTDLNPDGIVVKLSSAYSAKTAGELTEPLTDSAIDKVADWFVARAAEKNKDKTEDSK